MKTFNIILETEDGGKITFRDIEQKSQNIIEDAIAKLEHFKKRFAGPSDELKEALLPVCKRLSKK